MKDHTQEVEDIVFRFFDKWQRQMKVAMVIATIMNEMREKEIAIHENDAADYLYKMIEKNNFQTFGDIKNWRHSECVPIKYRSKAAF